LFSNGPLPAATFHQSKVRKRNAEFDGSKRQKDSWKICARKTSSPTQACPVEEGRVSHREAEKAIHEVEDPARREHDAQINEAR